MFDLEEDALSRERVEIVLQSLRSLTEEQLKTVVMRYYIGLSVPRVAILKGVKDRAIHARQARALDRLRKALHAAGIDKSSDIL